MAAPPTMTPRRDIAARGLALDKFLWGNAFIADDIVSLSVVQVALAAVFESTFARRSFAWVPEPLRLIQGTSPATTAAEWNPTRAS